MEIVDRREPIPENLLGHEEVAQVGSGEAAAGMAGASFLDWRRVFAIDRLPDVYATVRRIQAAVSSKARRSDAVEGVDAALDALEQVLGLADAEQMPLLRLREKRDRPVEHVVHITLGSAERSADRLSKER